MQTKMERAGAVLPKVRRLGDSALEGVLLRAFYALAQLRRSFP